MKEIGGKKYVCKTTGLEGVKTAEIAEAALKEAEKTAGELDAAAKKAKEEFEKANKAVEPADAAVKSAREKSKTVKTEFSRQIGQWQAIKKSLLSI